MPQVPPPFVAVMNTSSIKITVEIGTSGIDIKSSPLADAFLRVIQARLQEQVTPEFVAYCLYQAAKSMPPVARRPKKQGPTTSQVASSKSEGLTNEK
jgi:hypothetical protein